MREARDCRRLFDVDDDAVFYQGFSRSQGIAESQVEMRLMLLACVKHTISLFGSRRFISVQAAA